jgi:hypothetical protein
MAGRRRSARNSSTRAASALVALHRVDAGRAILDSADVQAAGAKLDLAPPQIAQLGSLQAVAIADQDHGRVAMPPPAALPGRSHQRLDLTAGEILAGANSGNYGV